MTVFRPTLAVTVALLAAPVLAAAEPLPVGTCINMGNHLEPERESGWGGKRLEAADFVRIRAAGFDTVRIPVRWSNKTRQQPDYAIENAWTGAAEGTTARPLERRVGPRDTLVFTLEPRP